MDQYNYGTRNQNVIGPGFTPPWAHPPNLIPIHGHHGPAGPRKRKKIEEEFEGPPGKACPTTIRFETQVISNLENKNSELRSLCKKYESRISDLVQNSSKEKSGFQLQISNLEKEISDLKKSEILPVCMLEENEGSNLSTSSENNEKTQNIQVNKIRVHYHCQEKFKNISDCQEQFKIVSDQKKILESKFSELDCKFANLQQTLHVTNLQRYQLKKANSELNSKIVSLDKELSEIKQKNSENDKKVVELSVVAQECPECALHESKILDLNLKSTKLQKNMDDIVIEKNQLIQTNIEVIKKNVGIETDLQSIQNHAKQVRENCIGKNKRNMP